MNQTIDVDDEVFERLKEAAVPFVDTTPNAVLRRLLELDGSTSPAHNAADVEFEARTLRMPDRSTARARSARKRSRKETRPPRAAAGSILAEDQYELPLLQALHDAGGSGLSRDIIQAAGKILEPRLTDVDREKLTSGSIRWENRMQFVRLKMIERGWMEKNVPRGTWAITELGRKQLEVGGK